MIEIADTHGWSEPAPPHCVPGVVLIRYKVLIEQRKAQKRLLVPDLGYEFYLKKFMEYPLEWLGLQIRDVLLANVQNAVVCLNCVNALKDAFKVKHAERLKEEAEEEANRIAEEKAKAEMRRIFDNDGDDGKDGKDGEDGEEDAVATEETQLTIKIPASAMIVD